MILKDSQLLSRLSPSAVRTVRRSGVGPRRFGRKNHIGSEEGSLSWWHLEANGLPRMNSDTDLRRPSQVLDEYWLIAVSKKGRHIPLTGRTGKWLLFVLSSEVDEVWDRIRLATESGLLREASKVSTARPNPNARDVTTKVVCIYTYDHEDEEDVMRVREELRRLGFKDRIPYKTDEATLSGKYQVRGDRKISKYYC